MEINPRVVFERLFGRPGTQAQRVARAKQDASILDSMTEDLSDLERGLGAARPRAPRRVPRQRPRDRTRIQRTEAAQQHRAAMSLDAPIGVPESYEEHVGLMFDLMAVAYQADLTRVFTFMMAREASMKTYPEIGDHRAASHDLAPPREARREDRARHAEHLPHVAVRQVHRAS